MLTIIGFWLVQCILALPLGVLVYRLTFPRSIPHAAYSLPLALILGYLVHLWLSVVLSLWMPLHFWVLICTSPISLAIGIWQRKANAEVFTATTIIFKQHWLLLTGILALLVIIFSAKAAAPAGSFDDGLYYIQTIKWLQNSAVIPGLANLHGRFGFNASLHNLCALYGYIPSGYNGFIAQPPLVAYNDAAELLLLLCCLYFVFSAFNFFAQNLAYSIACIAATLLLLFFGLPMLGAPTADAAVLALTLTSLIIILNPKANYWQLGKVLAVVITSAITIKLSAIWLLVLLAFVVLSTTYQYFRQKEKELHKLNSSNDGVLNFISQSKQILIITIICAIIIGPWLYRMWLLTGYVIYPVTVTMTDAPWRVLPYDVNQETRLVSVFARLGTFSTSNLSKDIPLSWANDWGKWPQVWFWKVLDAPDRLFLAFVGLALLANVLKLATQKARALWLLSLLGCLFVGICFWFIVAPSLRFGYGALLSSLVLAIYTFSSQNIKNENVLKLFGKALSYITLLSVIIIGVINRDTRVWKNNIIIPPTYPSVSIANINNSTLQLGTGLNNLLNTYQPVSTFNSDMKLGPCLGGQQSCSQCWNSQLGCTYEAKPWLYTNLKQGRRYIADSRVTIIP